MSCVFRKSTAEDLSFILGWLEKENEETGEEGSFWHNRDIIRKEHKRGDLNVLVAGEEVVAFFCGSVCGPDIFEVRPDVRDRGFGRMAAEKCIEIARSANVCVMNIECQPPSSIPFWEKMGFKLYEDRLGSFGSRYAYLVLSRSHDLPEGVARDVVIDFLPERAMYEEGVLPFSSAQLKGIEDRFGVIILPERAICFSPSMERHRDPVVRLIIDGKKIHMDKAKRQESCEICIEQGPCDIFYVDRIRLPR